MKKTFAAAAAILLLASAAFCKSVEAPVDSYDDGTEAAQKANEKNAKSGQKKETKIKWNTKKNKEAAMQGDPYNTKKMRGNRSFGERLLNLNKYTKIEPCSIYLRPTIGKMFARKGHLIYREGTDVAGFMMYYDSSAYALQFATASRSVVRDAINRYFKDFDERKLDRSASHKKTREVYGFCEGYEDFGIISGMMTNWSRPKVFLGYMFVSNTPYFTINVRRAQNLAYEGIKSEEAMLKGTTIEQTYYFTKAQANKLMVFLSDENIGSLQAASTAPESIEATDAYDDGAEYNGAAKAADAPKENEAAAKAAESAEDGEQTDEAVQAIPVSASKKAEAAVKEKSEEAAAHAVVEQAAVEKAEAAGQAEAEKAEPAETSAKTE